MRFHFIFLAFCPQPHTAFSLPSPTLINPSLSLTQDTAISNLSKPTSDTFPIPNTNLILRFEVFGPLLNKIELYGLLNRVHYTIQTLIYQHGVDAMTPNDEYHGWHNGDIVFDVVPRTQLTLGQFRSLIEGLELYMIDGERIYGRRYREVIFSLLRGGGGTVELGTLAKGDISLIKDGG